ncbi:MAG: class I SAM-dependent methyltransferase [Crocinitomicaceae bacterium]|jgi:23S rRNA (cytosine1962-C5)-methyltransferase|tara:strand:+ start:29204 stop:30052 length:849 start_codon:yes stop_codon:yes gene_type:complete
MSENKLFTDSWNDYELIDAGGGKKLERWGNIITIRPELQAYFHSGIPFDEWKKMAHWEFVEKRSNKGTWKPLKKNTNTSWDIKYKRLTFKLELTNYKHLGLFPEQKTNWDFIEEHLSSDDKFLNLFAYTGASSCVGRHIGADTYHLDSVKSVISWAKENMERSRLMNIRWVHEDALKFVNREHKRGNIYQGIQLDPPAWGLGAKGEKWKLEDKIDEMLAATSAILSEKGFLIMNTYSPTVDQEVLKELLSIYFSNRTITVKGLHMKTTSGKHLYFGELARVS